MAPARRLSRARLAVSNGSAREDQVRVVVASNAAQWFVRETHPRRPVPARSIAARVRDGRSLDQPRVTMLFITVQTRSTCSSVKSSAEGRFNASGLMR